MGISVLESPDTSQVRVRLCIPSPLGRRKEGLGRPPTFFRGGGGGCFHSIYRMLVESIRNNNNLFEKFQILRVDVSQEWLEKMHFVNGCFYSQRW